MRSGARPSSGSNEGKQAASVLSGIDPGMLANGAPSAYRRHRGVGVLRGHRKTTRQDLTRAKQSEKRLSGPNQSLFPAAKSFTRLPLG